MRRRWTCARWRPAGWSSPLALAVLAGCGGGGGQVAPAPPEAHLPVVGPAEACPVSATRSTADHRHLLGRGPAAPLPFGRGAVLEIAPPSAFGSREWGGQKVMWLVRPGAPAGLTVTGRNLDRAGGDVRFDDGDVPVKEIALPPPGTDGWAERPGFTRIRRPGCHAYVVRSATTSTVLVFRAVAIGHRDGGGDRVHGRSAGVLERAIVEPRGGESNGLAAPSSATCRAATARERRRNGFRGTPWEFSCAIAYQGGEWDYDVQVLPNWCYTAHPRQPPAPAQPVAPAIQACR